MALLNCPSFTTYSHVEKRTIREMQSNDVFKRRNTRLGVVKEFCFALFLQKKVIFLSFIRKIED